MTKKILASAVALSVVVVLAGCGKTDTPEIVLDNTGAIEVTSGAVEDIQIEPTNGDVEMAVEAVVEQPSEVVEANSGEVMPTVDMSGDAQAAMDAMNAALQDAGVDMDAVNAARDAALNAAQ